MSYTKEPWIVVPGGRHDPEVIITTQHRFDGRRGEICGMDVEFTGTHGDEQKANARRIVACVNACAGISTESMEVGGVGSILSLGLEEQRRGDIAEKLRDKLLAALMRAEEVFDFYAKHHATKTIPDEERAKQNYEYRNMCRKAIANAKGGA